MAIRRRIWQYWSRACGLRGSIKSTHLLTVEATARANTWVAQKDSCGTRKQHLPARQSNWREQWRTRSLCVPRDGDRGSGVCAGARPIP